MPTDTPSTSTSTFTNNQTTTLVARVDTEASFADALRRARSKLLVVNYGAEWCKHCAKLTPTFERLASEYGGSSSSSKEVDFVNADVDGLPFTARGVRWTPTVAFYRKGRLVDECARAKPTQVRDRVWLHCTEDPDAGFGGSS
jgi:thioredoxin 1